MRTRSRLSGGLLAGLAFVACATATTLQKLSLDDMIQQSTGIVRAKVTGSRAALRGQSVYTYYHLQILEAPKVLEATKVLEGSKTPGKPQQELEVAVPGGTAGGIRQIAIGSPELTIGAEYVLFLWTGKSGLTQIIGLSQGIFETTKDASGAIRLDRAAADEPMVDAHGKAVSSDPITLTWAQLRTQIQKELKK